MMIVVFSENSIQNFVPVSKDAIRGWVNVGGWYLENLNEKETRATLILENDLKGSIP